ncbi:predicted protein [Chaetoceros tenuissimus]|uniref:Uncharacterized protein n=1 Tax=Chaetoceros tenuissimus TaxID=426638 RepID=A0AAD3H0Y7_9STRA|nr:predicted protein [Chaetoceros tenuissimus]
MIRNRNIKANTTSPVVLSQHMDSDYHSSPITKKARKLVFQRRKIVTIQCAAVGICCLLCMMRTADYYDDSSVNAKEKVRHLKDNEVDAVNGHLPVSTSSLPIDTIPNKTVSPFDDESAVIPMYL